MLGILNRPVHVDFQNAANDASDDVSETSPAQFQELKHDVSDDIDALEVEDWDAVTMTESCRLATIGSD